MARASGARIVHTPPREHEHGDDLWANRDGTVAVCGCGAVIVWTWNVWSRGWRVASKRQVRKFREAGWLE